MCVDESLPVLWSVVSEQTCSLDFKVNKDLFGGTAFSQ